MLDDLLELFLGGEGLAFGSRRDREGPDPRRSSVENTLS